MPHRPSPHGYARSDRVAEQIRRELAMLIRDQVKDPRVGMVTLLDVNLSKDLGHAKVWFDVMDETHALETQAALNHAAGFLRRELGHVLKLRVTPELRFTYDDTQVKGNALSVLIDEAVASDHHPDPVGDAATEGSSGS